MASSRNQPLTPLVGKFSKSKVGPKKKFARAADDLPRPAWRLLPRPRPRFPGILVATSCLVSGRHNHEAEAGLSRQAGRQLVLVSAVEMAAQHAQLVTVHACAPGHRGSGNPPIANSI